MSGAPTTVLPPLSAAQFSDLVHTSLTGRVTFIAYPPCHRDVDPVDLFDRFYDEEPDSLFNFLFGLLRSNYLTMFSASTLSMQTLAAELEGRVLLDTNGVWIATTDTERSDLDVYASGIWSLPRGVRIMRYGLVVTEWLYPAVFAPDGTLVPVSRWQPNQDDERDWQM